MGWTSWVALVALIIAAVALVVAYNNWRSLRSIKHSLAQLEAHSAAARARIVAPGTEGPVVVIYNPVKIEDLEEFQAEFNDAARTAGLSRVEWIETSVEDPGRGQAKRAIEMGASLVVAAGGDGTVRVVGGVLAGTGIPMGIVPAGTGNLLALNLGLPGSDRRDRQIGVALTGRPRAIDVGWIEADSAGDELGDPDELRARAREIGLDPDVVDDVFTGTEPFLVISGLGFDAQTMAGTDADLKKRVGWFAYVVSGAKNLRRGAFDARVAFGDRRSQQSGRFHSVLFANCGMLPTGIDLAPEARVDSGWLEVGLLKVRGGLFGWLEVARQVLGRTGGQREQSSDFSSINFRRTNRANVASEQWEPIEADGDVLGVTRAVSVRVDPGALVVMN